jgi:hypothetical protein
MGRGGRILAMAAVVLVVGGAVVATFRLGNPLGMSTRTAAWAASATSGRVTVQSTVDDRDVVALAKKADAYFQAAGERFGIVPQPVAVRLFADVEAYREHGEANLPGFSPAMDYCFSPAERAVYGFWDRESAVMRRLQHELFHALARQGKRPPLWLDEGVAEHCEGCVLAEGRLVPEALQYDRLRSAARSLDDPAATMQALRTAGPKQFYGARGQRYYNAAYGVAVWLDERDQLGPSLAGRIPELDPTAIAGFLTDPDAWSTALDRTAQRERSRPLHAVLASVPGSSAEAVPAGNR